MPKSFLNTLPNTVQSQYNAQQAGITTAIVVAILLPIGICLFCFLLHIRNKAAEKREEKNANTYFPPIRATDTNERESRLAYKPNITTNGASRSSSSSGGQKKKFGRGDSNDKDSGIQTNDVRLHDDGRITLDRENDVAYENVRIQQQQQPTSSDSPVQSLKKGLFNANENLSNLREGAGAKPGSHQGSLSGDSSHASRNQNKSGFVSDVENDRGENEMTVSNPTFNDVVAQRSPVGRLPSSGSFKYGQNSPPPTSPESILSDKPLHRPMVNQPLGTSSDSSNMPSSARSSSRSNTGGRGGGGGAIPKVPLQKQVGPTLIGADKYSGAREPVAGANQDELGNPIGSPAQSDARYDGVYYTREPLNNKPKTDFPTKTMDVDIDMRSYKPHGGSKPSVL